MWLKGWGTWATAASRIIFDSKQISRLEHEMIFLILVTKFVVIFSFNIRNSIDFFFNNN